MRITQSSDGYSIVPAAVRPGNPDALFARTIDATQKPPLIKAQEAVVAAIPRLIDSVPPPLPLLGGTLGLAVLGVMMASHHVRFKFAPVLTSAVLLLPVSNYHEAQVPAQVQHAEAEVIMELPDPPEIEEYPAPSDDFLVPPEITEGVAPLVDMVVPDEWTDEQQLRILRRRAERLMEEIRKLRLEQEIEQEFERRRQALSNRYQRL